MADKMNFTTTKEAYLTGKRESEEHYRAIRVMYKVQTIALETKHAEEIEAGVIKGTIEPSSPPSFPTTTPLMQIQDPNPLHGYAQNQSGIDTDAQFPSTELSMSIKNESEGFYIPQQDGEEAKDKWECKLKAGVMQINEKNILFSEVDRCSGDDETRSETTSSSEKRCLERYEQEILHSLQWKVAEEQQNSSSSSGLSSNDSSRPATSKASSRDKLIDALEMMKQGVRRLLVLKSVVWRGMSKRFSILYNGKWLKNSKTLAVAAVYHPMTPAGLLLPRLQAGTSFAVSQGKT
ncbi:hypothetical protein Bca52824_002433 [Brassica carinata]|uniref:Uncharacterized protein n=1 Tax=Brassica carinata TaxID=52824 RepID=A0A8X8BEA7_BRACI|nr:hypothetical protein Bca52824_002433 [Brassica carinata]